MSKKTNISFLFSLACLLLAGCDAGSPIATPPGGEEAVEVRLKVSVCTVETTVSRSIISGTQLPDNAEIGIFGLKDRNDSFSTPYLENLQYIYEAGGNLKIRHEGSSVYYPAGQDKVYLYGYYPYTQTPATNETGEVSIPVKGTLGTDEVMDYLYTGEIIGSKSLAMAGNYAIPVTLKHAMSILRIKISTDAPEYTVESHPVLQSISFTTRESQNGAMNLRTGVITSDNPNNVQSIGFDYTSEALNMIAGQDPVVKEYLLFPYENATNSAIRKLTLNILTPTGESKEIIAFDETNTGGNQNPVIVRLQAGHITTINIKYSQSMAAKANVYDWLNDEEHTIE